MHTRANRTFTSWDELIMSGTHEPHPMYDFSWIVNYYDVFDIKSIFQLSLTYNIMEKTIHYYVGKQIFTYLESKLFAR